MPHHRSHHVEVHEAKADEHAAFVLSKVENVKERQQADIWRHITNARIGLEHSNEAYEDPKEEHSMSSEPDGERKYVDDWMILKDEDEKGPEVHECLCEVVPEQTNVGRKIWGVQDESIHLLDPFPRTKLEEGEGHKCAQPSDVAEHNFRSYPPGTSR